ncbi:hypothetical protein F4859DRAFT_498916 [Xylaria cf. heliscus]|nr:hypothetical protein F4859DRAFT_498916 [Xylaria cf. heliscus]
MGIRGLAAAVGRYGIFGSLEGNAVVIDGPALIFQILNGCMRERPATNSFHCHPSYSTLGRMVLGWLEELPRHNVTVRKIYFDGYLPPSKWQVRRERLMRQSGTMKDLLASHPHGSPRAPEEVFETIKPGISLIQDLDDPLHTNRFPAPPFLVPAAIEVLRSCRKWGPLVEVVSGEADMFCAEDIRRHGGVLLTSDSDLLITELGPHGTVSFFADIFESDRLGNLQGLMTRKYSLHNINNTLGFNNVGGLPRVAFEKMRHRTSFNEALSLAKNSKDNILESPEFRAFMEEYSMKEYLPMDHPVQGILSRLDPRISEVVIQTLLLDPNGTVPDMGRRENPRGPETLAMFLPIMIENRDRKSAWTMSTAVRELAYGAMQTFAVHESPTIIEYRVLDASNSLMGRQIDVPGPDETLEQCGLLVDALNQLTTQIPGADMQWLSFAIYQDVMWSSSEQKLPLSAFLMDKGKGAFNDEDKISWDMIHFTAQVQASLYSLRMVTQVLDVVASLRKELPPPMQELRERLSTLPPITEWPTVETMSQILATANEANVLSVIEDIIGVKIIQNPKNSSKSRRARKQKSRRRLPRSERDPERSTSANPFAVLSNESLG